jgi:cytosine/adenosine deaminase-related metal-dependent hydrolase
LVRLSRSSSDRPILITEAPVNADDEYDRRRKRYLVMMTLRAVCIIGAASTFSLSGWLAAGFVAAAVVLPWSAVLIANDRPPKQELRFRRFLGGQQVQRQLTAGQPQPQPPATEPEDPARPRIIDL